MLDCLRVDSASVGMATAEVSVLLYRIRPKQRRAIPSNVLWNASSCLEHGAVLFTLAVHFKAVHFQVVHFERDDDLRQLCCLAEALP